MKLQIFTSRGQECVVKEIEVDRTIKISEIKNHVFEKFQIPAKDQRLMFCGRTLKDTYSLAYYHKILDDSALKLVEIKRHSTAEFNELKALIRVHLVQNYSPEDTDKILNEFVREFYRSARRLSLVDYENIAEALLFDEQQKNQ